MGETVRWTWFGGKRRRVDGISWSLVKSVVGPVELEEIQANLKSHGVITTVSRGGQE